MKKRIVTEIHQKVMAVSDDETEGKPSELTQALFCLPDVFHLQVKRDKVIPHKQSRA